MSTAKHPEAALADARDYNRSGRRRPDRLPPLSSPVLSRFAAAPYCGIGLTKLYELTASGEIPSILIGSRRLYPVEDLDRYLAERVSGGDSHQNNNQKVVRP